MYFPVFTVPVKTSLPVVAPKGHWVARKLPELLVVVMPSFVMGLTVKLVIGVPL